MCIHIFVFGIHICKYISTHIHIHFSKLTHDHTVDFSAPVARSAGIKSHPVISRDVSNTTTREKSM